MTVKYGIRGNPGSGELAYAYAKACGITGKSFAGKRTSSLVNAGSLSELDRIIFPGSSRNLPEKELLPDLEKRIIKRAINSVISIMDSFSRLPDFFTLLIRSYEYEDLINFIISSQRKDEHAPSHNDIGRFQTVRFDAWPDIKAMIKGTEFEFLLDKDGGIDREQALMQTALDRHYYNALWNSHFSLRANDRLASQRILSDEISLRNSSWTLRLRTFYQMKADEIKPYLIEIPAVRKNAFGKKTLEKTFGKTLFSRSLADEALQCLEWPLDNFTPWASWRWMKFLNPDTDTRNWHVDPRHFQNAASKYLFSLARHYFHRDPFSLDTIFCFIKIKQFEEDILISIAEGLGMGMSAGDVISSLGVMP